jgi:urease accessory protein
MSANPLLQLHRYSREAPAHVLMHGPTTTVTLAFEMRQRSRLRVRLNSGQDAAIVLERGLILRGGDFLGAEPDTWVEVISEAEPVSVVTADDVIALMRAAYHIGNRHVPLEVRSSELRFLSDHVLDDMVRGLGVDVNHAKQPFEPEAGAYAHGHHSHSASHERDDGTDHSHSPGNSTGHTHSHTHR